MVLRTADEVIARSVLAASAAAAGGWFVCAVRRVVRRAANEVAPWNVALLVVAHGGSAGGRSVS